MAERIAHPCAHPECLNPGTRLIWWRDGTTAGRTWACDEHVAELRQERVGAGCTVIGGLPRGEASLPRGERKHINQLGVQARNDLVAALNASDGIFEAFDRPDYLMLLDDIAAELRRRLESDSRSSWPPALLPCLRAAVPLRIEELQGATFEERHALAEDASDELCAHGDDFLCRGAQPGDTARAFQALVTALAVLAHSPGGVALGALHWEAPADVE